MTRSEVLNQVEPQSRQSATSPSDPHAEPQCGQRTGTTGPACWCVPNIIAGSGSSGAPGSTWLHSRQRPSRTSWRDGWQTARAVMLRPILILQFCPDISLRLASGPLFPMT